MGQRETEMENFLLRLLVLRCHSPKVTGMAETQEVRQSRNLAGPEDTFVGKQTAPRGGQAACPGQQQLLPQLASPALGWLADFERCKKNPNNQPDRKTTSCGLKDPTNSA